MATSKNLTGVVLLNMGGPDSLDAVEPFLFNLFHDNDILPLPLGGFLLQWPLAKLISSRRARFMRGLYAKIGGKSPIAKITKLQARLLEQRLNRESGEPHRCYVAMRYWNPLTEEAVTAMKRDGVTRIVALTLYPHYTTATTDSSLRELQRALAGAGLDTLPLTVIDRYPDDPRYLDALAHRVHFGLARKFSEEKRRGAMILFSAHGLPISFIQKGDPYVDHLRTTITGVIARLSLALGYVPEWQLSFQSRAGRAKWLEPSTEQTIKELAAAGRREVLAVPISFVSDHIETLYEIDMLFGDEARALGVNFRRAPSINHEPLFIDALAGLVERALAAPRALAPAHAS